jgi:hypothetical protein
VRKELRARSTFTIIFDIDIDINSRPNLHLTMATKTMAARLPPRLGTKQIFLYVPIPAFPFLNSLTPPLPSHSPNFTLTLLRPPPGTPPSFASFLVPLNLNKLDLRDYLWNGYGVRVKGVRSYIQQQKVRQDKPGAKRPAQRRWYRPRAIKKMMVELEEPFAWREEPQSLEP